MNPSTDIQTQGEEYGFNTMQHVMELLETIPESDRVHDIATSLVQFLRVALDRTAPPIPEDNLTVGPEIEIRTEGDLTDARVQMIDARHYEGQGLVQYAGDSEGVEAWLDSLCDYDTTLMSDNVMGWDQYTHVVKLASIVYPEDPPLYYLVPPTVAERLGLTEEVT